MRSDNSGLPLANKSKRRSTNPLSHPINPSNADEAFLPAIVSLAGSFASDEETFRTVESLFNEVKNAPLDRGATEPTRWLELLGFFLKSLVETPSDTLCLEETYPIHDAYGGSLSVSQLSIGYYRP